MGTCYPKIGLHLSGLFRPPKKENENIFDFFDTLKRATEKTT